MIEWMKARWHEPSTKIGLAVLLLVWAAAIAASLLVTPERWPQVKEALEWPLSLANAGAMAAILYKQKGKGHDGGGQ
jgi:hypothetical protein